MEECVIIALGREEAVKELLGATMFTRVCTYLKFLEILNRFLNL
jgi:hypothetical protein